MSVNFIPIRVKLKLGHVSNQQARKCNFYSLIFITHLSTSGTTIRDTFCQQFAVGWIPRNIRKCEIHVFPFIMIKAVGRYCNQRDNRGRNIVWSFIIFDEKPVDCYNYYFFCPFRK